MNRIVAVISIVFSFSVAGAAQATVNVVNSYSLPANIDNPQDLAWDGSSLWLGNVADSKIYEINPANGMVLSDFDAPGSNPFALASDGSRLFHSTLIFGGNDIVYILTFAGGIITSWPLTNSPESSGQGAAYDPATGHLWIADGTGADRLYEFDPSDGSLLSVVPYPATDAEGLAWRNGRIVAVDDEDLALYEIDTVGNIVGTASIAALGGDPRGLTWDGQYFWLSVAEEDEQGEELPGTLYQLQVVFESAVLPPAAAPLLSTGGLIGLTALLGAVFSFAIRRRRIEA